MTRAGRFILVVIVSLLVAAVVLYPKHDEHAAMLAGEGRHAEAIALVQGRLAAAPHDPDLLAALGRSYAALGQIPQAVDAFDAYLAARPDDFAAREREAELLLQSGRLDRYLDALARATAAAPSPERITRLVERYRLHGRVEDEIGALQTYAGKGLLDAAQLERLGALLAYRGDSTAARRWLELADREAKPDSSAGRFLLVEVMILNNAVEQIEDRARGWMVGWRSPFLAAKLISRIARSGHAGVASRLALAYVDAAPNAALQIVGAIAAAGRPDLARRMLVRWAASTNGATGDDLHVFVQESALLGSVDVALEKFLRQARSGGDAATMGRLAEDLVNSFGNPALVAIRPLLSTEALLSRPLFAAELSLWDGDRDLASRRLTRIDPKRLPPEERTVWRALAQCMDMDPDAFGRLLTAWGGEHPPAEWAGQCRR